MTANNFKKQFDVERLQYGVFLNYTPNFGFYIKQLNKIVN